MKRLLILCLLPSILNAQTFFQFVEKNSCAPEQTECLPVSLGPKRPIRLNFDMPFFQQKNIVSPFGHMRLLWGQTSVAQVIQVELFSPQQKLFGLCSYYFAKNNPVHLVGSCLGLETQAQKLKGVSFYRQ